MTIRLVAGFLFVLCFIEIQRVEFLVPGGNSRHCSQRRFRQGGVAARRSLWAQRRRSNGVLTTSRYGRGRSCTRGRNGWRTFFQAIPHPVGSVMRRFLEL